MARTAFSINQFDEKCRLWKNVLVVSISFMFLFSSFNAVGSLQSTINSDGGLGNISQAVIYTAMIISSMFFPTLIIKKLGLKWTMVLCQSSYSFSIAAQFYPTFGTLIPTSIAVGFAAAPLWAAQATYLTRMGILHTSLTNSDKEMVQPSISRLFGVFFAILGSSTIWGSLIGSLVLSSGSSNSSKMMDDGNRTLHCGVNFCYEDRQDELISNITNNPQDANPANSNIPMLMGIFLGIAMLSTLILALFLDNPLDGSEDAGSSSTEASSEPSSWQMMTATFRQMGNPNQLLIIPLIVSAGFEGSSWTADFNYAFINCYLGVEMIGYITMCLGVASVIVSLLCSHLIKIVGRVPFFICSAIIHCVTIATCQFFWNPNPDKPEIFFIIATLWGAGSSMTATSLSTLIGVLFTSNKEAAFSNGVFWQSIGFAIPFAYSSFLCVDTKLYILMGLLAFGMVGYLTVEVKEHKRLKDGNLNNNVAGIEIPEVSCSHLKNKKVKI